MTPDRSIKELPPRVASFVDKASSRLPGIVCSFNIADFKRRNGHLGHVVGDDEIAELDCLLWQLGPHVISERTHGDRWFVMAPESTRSRLELVIDRFALSEPIRVGFEVTATKESKTLATRDDVEAVIQRAVRCLYEIVRTRSELEAVVLRILNNDYSLPPSRLIRVEEIDSLPREQWQCVSRYPTSLPSCPFCRGKEVDWTDGDMSMYGGDGHCKGCGAELSIRDVEELLKVDGEPKPTLTLGYEIFVDVATDWVAITEERGRRLLISLLQGPIGSKDEVLYERPPWDLPLLRVRAESEGERAPSVLVELLPRGMPSDRSKAHETCTTVPPFVVTVAAQFAEAQALDETVGPLHPSLVFVDDDGRLVACAQRSLRVRAHIARRRELTTSAGKLPTLMNYLTPSEALHGRYDAADDVFVLGALIWGWRRSEPPFGTEAAGALGRIMKGTPIHEPADDFDRLLLRALSVDPQKRPSAIDLLVALRALGDKWRLPAVDAEHPNIARMRADAQTMAKFLEERIDAGDCERARLHVELTIEADAESEDVLQRAYVFAAKQDGNGDAYGFSGDPDTLSGSFARRIGASRSKPETSAIDRLAEAIGRVAGSTELPPFDDARTLVKQLRRQLKQRAAKSKPTNVLRTTSDVKLRLKWRFYAVAKRTHIERTDIEIIASIDHRFESSEPPRLYGEEHTESVETSASARRTFRHLPKPEELDALVAEALEAKPWLS